MSRYNFIVSRRNSNEIFNAKNPLISFDVINIAHRSFHGFDAFSLSSSAIISDAEQTESNRATLVDRFEGKVAYRGITRSGMEMVTENSRTFFPTMHSDKVFRHPPCRFLHSRARYFAFTRFLVFFVFLGNSFRENRLMRARRKGKTLKYRLELP